MLWDMCWTRELWSKGDVAWPESLPRGTVQKHHRCSSLLYTGGMSRSTWIIFLWPVGIWEEESVKFGILRSIQNQSLMETNPCGSLLQNKSCLNFVLSEILSQRVRSPNPSWCLVWISLILLTVLWCEKDGKPQAAFSDHFPGRNSSLCTTRSMLLTAITL